MPGRHTAAPPVHGRRRAPVRPDRRRRGLAAGGAGVVVALVAVLMAAGAVPRFGSGSGSDCADGQRLTLAAAPEIAPVVRRAAAGLDAEALQDAGVCGVRVVGADPDDVLGAVGAGTGTPDLWVPDTSAWLSQLPSALSGRSTRSLAKSPVVLAGPPGSASPETWLAALSAPGAALLDPRESGASVGALAALHAEAVHGITTGSALSTWLAGAARRAPDTGLSDTDLLTEGEAGQGEAAQGDGPRWFPTTEQRFLADGGHGGLAMTVPLSGTVLMDYPLVSLARGEATGPAGEVADRIAARLASPAGQRRLAEAGFRPVSGVPTQAVDGVGRVAEIGVVQPEPVAGLLTTWSTLTTDARMLAVLDVSGSMKAAAGDRTRIQLARDALLTVLRTLPDGWDLGLWAFSVRLGDGASDHRVLAPVRTVSATSGGTTQRQRLADAARRLPGLVGGGTGLYDTTLAAYREVADGYRSDRYNSVVLLTDGRNEDPHGLDLRGLLDALAEEEDAARPVPVITIGVGPQADTSALRRIARATGGVSYVARDPRDLERILGDALLERAGWGLQ